MPVRPSKRRARQQERICRPLCIFPIGFGLIAFIQIRTGHEYSLAAFQNSRPFRGHVFNQEGYGNFDKNDTSVNIEVHVPQPTLAESSYDSNQHSTAPPSERNVTRSAVAKDALGPVGHDHDNTSINGASTTSGNSAESTPAVVPRKPNVLFIMADDLRPQLGLYGHRAYTPNLDALAARGTTFERAYAQITVCNPSRASFLSGRRPDTTEIYGFEAASPPGWTTIPALFRRQGYTTFGVGKIFHWGPGPPDAWTNEVAAWSPEGHDSGNFATGGQSRVSGRNANGGSGSSWETPYGRASNDLYHDATTLNEEEDSRGRGDGGKVGKEKRRVRGFWPSSDEFQAMKGAEQRVLLSTMHPEPRPDEKQEIQGTGRASSTTQKEEAEAETEAKSKSSQLPFRDGIYASRAQKLLSLAAAQRDTLSDGTSVPKPWLLMVGFSLPHEPVRFPKWAWDIYADDVDDGDRMKDNDDDNDDEMSSSEGSVSNRSVSGQMHAGGGGGDGVKEQPMKQRERLPIAAAMHATRPLGSPIFAFGDLKERFVYYDRGSQQQRKLAIKVNYGPGKGRKMPVDPNEPIIDKHKEAVEATKERSRRAAYAEKLTRGSRGQAAAVVRGDDYFGTLDSEIWADSGNEIKERSLPLDARQELARGYSAACTFLDYQVGRVLSALKALPDDAAANTLIVFTADHGFSLGDQGGWGKRTLWETDARVPLIVVPPTLQPPTMLYDRQATSGALELPPSEEEGSDGDVEGKVRTKPPRLLKAKRRVRSRALVELVDLFPTLIDFAGLHKDPLPQATAEHRAAATRDANISSSLGGLALTTPLPHGRRRPDDSAAALNEPPLDGSSFAHLLYHRSLTSNGNPAAQQRRRATSQFPRCPVKVSRAGVRKCLLNEPWRSSGAGGFECQGRSSDWNHNHELAIMGYSMRTNGWRLTAWVRVVGYAQPQAGSALAAAKAAAVAKKSAHLSPVWLHQRLVANWTWPPYFTELYDHRAEDFMEEEDDNGGETTAATTTSSCSRGNGGNTAEEVQAPHNEVPQFPNLVERPLPGSPQGSFAPTTVDAATRELLESGGGFDLSEAANVASQHPGVSEQLFYELRELFDHGLR